MKGLIINHDMNCRNIHRMFPNCDEVFHSDFTLEITDNYDYFILSGGEINISGEKDLILEKQFIKTTKKPIFGICLGMQIICICYNEILKDLGYRIKNKQIIKYDNTELNITYDHGWYIDRVPNGFHGYIENNILHWVRKDNILAFQGHPELSISKDEITNIFKDLIYTI